MAALIERAWTLHVISNDARTSLYKRLSARGYRTHEPFSDELTPESPQLSTEIAKHLVSIGIPEDDIATMAGFRGPSFNDLFRLPATGTRLRLVQ